MDLLNTFKCFYPKTSCISVAVWTKYHLNVQHTLIVLFTYRSCRMKTGVRSETNNEVGCVSEQLELSCMSTNTSET